MANFVYTYAKYLLGTGGIDLDAADLRSYLMMSNTTADTEKDAEKVGSGGGNGTTTGFGTIDECDGSGYTKYDHATITPSQDSANDRFELDLDDAAYGAVGASTRQIVGVMITKYDSGTPANSIPIAWIDTVSGGTAFPFSTNGGTVTIQWSAEGAIQIT